MIARPRLTVVRPAAVRELRQPSRSEGSVWRRGYACGRQDRRLLWMIAGAVYAAIGWFGAVLTKGWIW